jgi:hypothetical protein
VVQKTRKTLPEISSSETPDLPLLVTTARAAELLSVSPWEIRRLVRKGLLQHKTLSKTNWLIVVQSLKKFASAA